MISKRDILIVLLVGLICGFLFVKAGWCSDCMGSCKVGLPCAGDCGCVIRKGQTWGRCASYGVMP